MSVELNFKSKERSKPFSNPLVVALDVDSKERAIQLVESLNDIVGGFKIGPRLCMRYGREIVEDLAKRGVVFVDNKYFDIPSTTLAAVRATFDAGASVTTVHALVGRETLHQLAELESELNSARPFRILAVTILTSWSERTYPEIMKKISVFEAVKSLSEMVFESGLTSIVCSPHEVHLMEGGKNRFVLTPGVRFVNDGHGDQQRVMSPSEALRAGASAIVVGRPIIEASNPRMAASRYAADIFGNL